MTNTGHFISMPRGATQAEMLEPLSQPGVAGLQIRYLFRDIEGPAPDDYYLRQIAWDCSIAHALGKTVVVMIEDKTFGDKDRGITGDYPAPNYLKEFAFPNRQNGYTMARWRPEVSTRLRKLADTIRAQNFPGFGGIAFQETAPGLESAELEASGYRPDRYEIALLYLSWSCDFLYLNYIPQGQDRLKRIIRESACAVGGPDLLPDNDKLLKDVYPYFMDADVPNAVTMFTSCQFHSLNHAKKNGSGIWTLDELVNWGRDKLRVSTIFWNRPWPGMKGHTMAAIYEAIARRPDL